MNLKLKLFFFYSLFLTTYAIGQEVDSISVTRTDDLFIVKYDFNKGEEGVDYELYLYGSHDNFSTPLKYTTGDVGKKIKIGAGKVIYWNAKKELGNFKGDFTLKIKGSNYIPFVTFKNINKDLSIKRGHTFDIRWETSEKTSTVLFKIQRYGVPILDAQVVNNNGHFSWEIPAKVKPGKGYTVQIMDKENSLREETSEEFILRRKVPLAYKIIPMAVLAGTAAILLSTEEKTGIPDPPAPPY